MKESIMNHQLKKAMETSRKTYRFVRRLMQNPETKARIRARAEEIRAEEGQR